MKRFLKGAAIGGALSILLMGLAGFNIWRTTRKADRYAEELVARLRESGL